jgi:hypothetical protein
LIAVSRDLEDPKVWNDPKRAQDLGREKKSLEDVVLVLAQTGLKPERLEIEVTESIFLRDASVARNALEQVMALGCSVALDDFGTGYSSLGYLRKLRFSTIKVDRTFDHPPLPAFKLFPWGYEAPELFKVAIARPPDSLKAYTDPKAIDPDIAKGGKKPRRAMDTIVEDLQKKKEKPIK